MRGLGLAPAVLASVTALVAAGSPAPSIEALAWLAGDWRAAREAGRLTEEHWSAPLGGAMLGTSRTLLDGRMVEFEFLRIVERDDGIFYVAQPGGRAPGTEFKLTKLGAAEAVFENPAHDFPKRIVYRRHDDGSLTATVDGGEGTRGPVFAFRPMDR